MGLRGEVRGMWGESGKMSLKKKFLCAFLESGKYPLTDIGVFNPLPISLLLHREHKCSVQVEHGGGGGMLLDCRGHSNKRGR